jgi:hypothetical protein
MHVHTQVSLAFLDAAFVIFFPEALVVGFE